jgi:hypothetical protein
MTFVQVGIAVLRDPATGEPLKPRIPLYAKTRAEPQPSGLTRGEENLLTDVAGVFVDVFRKYADEIKKIKNMEDIPK